MKSARIATIAGLVLALSRIAAAQDVSAEQFVIIPLRVHVLTSTDIDQANCKMTEADAARVVGNINAIWHKAGIHFGVESILREPVVQRERFLIVAGLGGGQVEPERSPDPAAEGLARFDGVHVYFFHDLPFNSAFLGDDVVFSNEQAQVNPIDGGSKDPVARVTAHALGNLLTLPNVNDPRNLMGGGTSGMALAASQAQAARKVARTIAGATTVADVRKAEKAAQAKGDTATVRRLHAWLAEIPGDRGGRNPEGSRRRGIPPVAIRSDRTIASSECPRCPSTSTPTPARSRKRSTGWRGGTGSRSSSWPTRRSGCRPMTSSSWSWCGAGSTPPTIGSWRASRRATS